MLCSTKTRAIDLRAVTIKLTLLAMCATRTSYGQELPTDVRTALERNAEALSPVSVTWVRRRSSPLSPQQLFKRLQRDHKPDFFEPYRIQYSWNDGKYRAFATFRNILPTGGGAVNVSYKESSFDGEFWYSGTGMNETAERGENPVLMVERISKAKQNPGGVLVRTDYFRAAGFVLPETAADMGRPAQSMLIALLEEGAEVRSSTTQDLEGTRHHVIELAAQDKIIRFFLDPQRNYAVAKRVEQTPDGRPILVVECRNFELVPNTELWLPRHCRRAWHTWYTIPGEYDPDPIVFADIEAAELNNVDGGTFVLNYDFPGSIISDARIEGAEQTQEGRVAYRAPANPADLDEAIRKAVEGEGYAPPVPSVWRWMLILLVNFMLAAAIVAGWLYKQRSQKA